MFTGIIETQGVIKKTEAAGSGMRFWIKSPLSSKLKPDQSLSHDGVCLTIEKVKGSAHVVTAVKETLGKSNLGSWQAGRLVNLERGMKLGDRIDGHLVQGHVDAKAVCSRIIDQNGSKAYGFRIAGSFANLMVEKGSIAVNGVSLTIFNLDRDYFEVAVIPYTLKHTNLGILREGDEVNIEFDMIGKYLQRNISLRNQTY